MNITFAFVVDFLIESYLRHQGVSFVDRFDANSYLYITKAMDYFDLAANYQGHLAAAFADSEEINFGLVSFSDDWLFPSSESKKIVKALSHKVRRVSFVEIESKRGHDSFLIKNQQLSDLIRGFLKQK